MKNYSICFNVLYNKFVTWTWQELLFGIKNNIIIIEDIVNYTKNTISKDDYDFDIIMEILIDDINEVEHIVEKLALKEKTQNIDDMTSKWIFLIIYYYYISDRERVFDIIDDIYCEFDYPLEISGLVTYMPKEDGNHQDDTLNKYIKNGEDIWFAKN